MRMRAPIFCSPVKWRSTGRAPMAQPPGSETRARPKRARSGPSTRTLARIVFTISYGASGLATCSASTCTVAPSRSTRAPMWPSSLPSVRMSARSGTPRKMDRPSASSAAAICGSVAFFEPDTCTSPDSGLPPVISIASIYAPFPTTWRSSPEVTLDAQLRQPRLAQQDHHRLSLRGIDLRDEQSAGRQPIPDSGGDPADDGEAVVAPEDREVRLVLHDVGSKSLRIRYGHVGWVRRDRIVPDLLWQRRI